MKRLPSFNLVNAGDGPTEQTRVQWIQSPRSASANARAVAGRADRPAVRTETTNAINFAELGEPVRSVPSASAAAGRIRCRRMQAATLATSPAPSPMNGRRRATISYNTTHSDQTSSASPARLPAQHFGRHVRQGAACRLIMIVRQAGQTEIEQLRGPVRREPDVARLDVAAHVSGVVQRRQSLGHGHADRLRTGQWSPIDAGRKRAAVQELDDMQRAATPR